MVNRNSDILDALTKLDGFLTYNLRDEIVSLEAGAKHCNAAAISQFMNEQGITGDMFEAARYVKSITGQINVIIHALGILTCLPKILEENETVEYVSLGAGNTGKEFDLETNLRVAEFKFIDWKGGAESIRQNGVFKDYYALEASRTSKRKQLYLSGTEYALKFLKGGRSLNSVLSRNVILEKDFRERFGGKFERVRDYYADFSSEVELIDVARFLN